MSGRTRPAYCLKCGSAATHGLGVRPGMVAESRKVSLPKQVQKGEGGHGGLTGDEWAVRSR